MPSIANGTSRTSLVFLFHDWNDSHVSPDVAEPAQDPGMYHCAYGWQPFPGFRLPKLPTPGLPACQALWQKTNFSMLSFVMEYVVGYAVAVSPLLFTG